VTDRQADCKTQTNRQTDRQRDRMAAAYAMLAYSASRGKKNICDSFTVM